MKFMLYRWNVFNQEDIKSALEYYGHLVEYYEEPEEVRRQEEYHELSQVVKEYDAVISANYFPRVSNACMAAGRKYISWTVDSPMLSMYHKSVFNSCNYIFVFDKFNYYQFKSMGADNVYYMPLAVNTKRVDELLNRASKEELIKYQSDVSFVGGLYYKNSYDDIKDKLPEYLKGYFDGAMWSQMDIFGENIFDNILTVDILAALSEVVDFRQSEDSMSDLKLVFTNTFLGFKMAQLERVHCLGRLGKYYNVDLYTDRMHPDLTEVNYRGTVDYINEMPKVFNQSKINMNFTIRNIRTGLSLRIWDVLGAGGFLLTNYQVEIPAYFENGKDLVYYEDLADMERKVEYYLGHEDERMTIAESGNKKVKALHSYVDRIGKMLEIAEIPRI